ncbi:hypothetical protein FB451DRAFT_1180036 [Mycena latifolia]|nr:hypothetical protein FB451DRAFT_1180036 [Mycena latifolia]
MRPSTWNARVSRFSNRRVAMGTKNCISYPRRPAFPSSLSRAVGWAAVHHDPALRVDGHHHAVGVASLRARVAHAVAIALRGSGGAVRVRGRVDDGLAHAADLEHGHVGREGADEEEPETTYNENELKLVGEEEKRGADALIFLVPDFEVGPRGRGEGDCELELGGVEIVAAKLVEARAGDGEPDGRRALRVGVGGEPEGAAPGGRIRARTPSDGSCLFRWCSKEGGAEIVAVVGLVCDLAEEWLAFIRAEEPDFVDMIVEENQRPPQPRAPFLRISLDWMKAKSASVPLRVVSEHVVSTRVRYGQAFANKTPGKSLKRKATGGAAIKQSVADCLDVQNTHRRNERSNNYHGNISTAAPGRAKNRPVVASTLHQQHYESRIRREALAGRDIRIETRLRPGQQHEDLQRAAILKDMLAAGMGRVLMVEREMQGVREIYFSREGGRPGDTGEIQADRILADGEDVDDFVWGETKVYKLEMAETLVAESCRLRTHRAVECNTVESVGEMSCKSHVNAPRNTKESRSGGNPGFDSGFLAGDPMA